MYVNKKPLNAIEVPVQPFIQKDPPRYYTVPKHWEVHVDDVLKNQHDNTQLIGDSILAVAYDENKRRYGQNSYIPKVNKEFRPPLIDPEYDTVPLSRIPRPRTRPRLNPDSYSHAQNNHGQDVSSHIDHRELIGNVRPTFVVGMEKSLNHITPDLKFTTQSVNAKSGVNSQIQKQHEYNVKNLEYINPQVNAKTNFTTNVQFNNNKITPDLDYKNPQVNAKSGLNPDMEFTQLTMLEEYDYKNPQVNVKSGVNPNMKNSHRNNVQILNNKNPHVNAKSGFNSNIKMSQEKTIDFFDYKNPQVNAKSGTQTNIRINHDTNVEDLDYVNPQVSVNVNPGMQMDLQDYKPQTINLQDTLDVSYKINPEFNYKQYERRENPTMKENLQYNRSISANANIPRGVQNMNPTLKGKKGQLNQTISANSNF